MMNKRKTASLILSAVLLLNLAPAASVGAEGTVSISTESDFEKFAEQCVYDEYSKNKTFVLANDINFGGKEIKYAGVFCGTFEGGGHSLTNFKLTAEGSNKGLFARVTKDAYIKDLNVTGEIRIAEDSDGSSSTLRQRAESILSRLDVVGSDNSNNTEAAGGIAGYNEGKIVNCSFGGKITAQNRVGGIAGFNGMTGIIDSCANGSAVNGKSEIGGIAGYNEGRIKLSKNTGAIGSEADESTSAIGGISGNSEGAVFACTNDGEVGDTSFGDNVGGICGKQSGEIRECVNNGEIHGRRSVGGICGRFEPYTDVDLSYESARDAIDKQIDIYKNDVEEARQKIIDYVDELLDAHGLISDILDRLGIEKGSTGDRLDRFTNSATRMMDSVTNAVDSANSSDLSSSLKDTLNSVSEFSDEARQSLIDAEDSIDTSLDNLNDFLNEFDGKGKEITDTLNNLNDAINSGSDDIDEIKDRLFDELDTMNDDIDEMLDRLKSTSAVLQTSMRTIAGAGSSADDLFEDLGESVKTIQSTFKNLKTAIEDLKKRISDRTSNIKNNIPDIRDRADEARQNAEEVIEEIQGYTVDENNSLDREYDVAPSIVGYVKDMLNVTAYAADDDKIAISDLKTTDITLPRLIGGENADTALIKYSINNADIEGHEMTGGTVGSVGFESVIRTGENMTLPDGTKVNADSVLKAVIESCISDGSITSKTSYAGGIVGKCDIGDIKNSLSTGEVEVTDGSYAGGIAGYSSGDILNCIAINDLSSKTYTGGIAGSGKNINTSYSLARIEASNDKSGAIAGYISEEVEGTYFIDEGLSGINGADYEGRAEAVLPDNIATDNGSFPAKMPLLNNGSFYMASGDLYMPQIKTLAENNAEVISSQLKAKSEKLARFHFDVVFSDKDKELKSMTVNYGTKLSTSDIPRLTADGDEIPAWDKDVYAPIVRHTKFTSEYNKATMTISSGEEPPLILVESIFDDNTEVILRDEDTERSFDGYTKGAAYSFTLTHNAYDDIKVHIRDDKKKAAKIAVEENGKWTLLDCEMDGSYAIFTVGAPCKFVILYPTGSYVLIFIICGGALLIAAAAFAAVFIRRKKKEKKVD